MEIKVQAKYVREGLDPFRSRLNEGDFGRITATVDENMSDADLENLAIKATPEGYKFQRIFRETEEGYDPTIGRDV